MGTLSEHLIESQDSTQRKGNIYFASICLWDKRIEGVLPKGLTQFSDDPGLTNYYDPVNNPEHDPRFFEEPKRTVSKVIERDLNLRR